MFESHIVLFSLSCRPDILSSDWSSPSSPDWLEDPGHGQKEPHWSAVNCLSECLSLRSYQSCQFVLEVRFQEATQVHVDWQLVGRGGGLLSGLFDWSRHLRHQLLLQTEQRVSVLTCCL